MSGRNTRLVVRVLQQKEPLRTSRATRLTARVLQRRTIVRTSRVTRFVTRMLQQVYALSTKTVETPDLPAAMPAPFLHNWQSFVSLETAFLTDVTASAGSASEERRSLRSSPGRTETVTFTGLTKADSARLIAACLRYMHQLNVFPLYSDVMLVTAASSGSVLKCSPDTRRVFVGQLLLVCEWNGRRLVNAQYLTVQNVSSVRVATDPITGTIPAGAKIFPMMQIVPSLDVTPVLLTDDKVAVALTATEVLGATTLPPSAEDNEVELDFVPWSAGRPIFSFGFDWSESLQVKLVRAGEKYGQGRDQIVDLAAARPQFGFIFKRAFLSRGDFWEYLRFAESRRGRQIPFWVVNPQTLFTVYGISGSDIEVEPTTDDAVDWSVFLEYLGVLKTDGTYYISSISSVAIDGVTKRITFTMDSAPGFTGADVRRVTSAHLCRFARDNVSERWSTAGVVHVESEIIELLNEVSAPVDGTFPDPIT